MSILSSLMSWASGCESSSWECLRDNPVFSLNSQRTVKRAGISGWLRNDHLRSLTAPPSRVCVWILMICCNSSLMSFRRPPPPFDVPDAWSDCSWPKYHIFADYYVCVMPDEPIRRAYKINRFVFIVIEMHCRSEKLWEECHTVDGACNSVASCVWNSIVANHISRGFWRVNQSSSFVHFYITYILFPFFFYSSSISWVSSLLQSHLQLQWEIMNINKLTRIRELQTTPSNSILVNFGEPTQPRPEEQQ